MDAVGLPARIGYAAVALSIAGAAGFYSGIWLLPKLAMYLHGPDANLDGRQVFKAAVFFGAMAAFSAFLVALTLPWKRRRRRNGRRLRIVVSCVFVVVASLAVAGLGHPLIYDLAFVAWLAYLLAYTYVRYGVLDQSRHRAGSGDDAHSDSPH